MKKICVVTGGRAEYGLLRYLMQGIQREPGLSLQIVATGAHMSPEFGSSYREIEGDGFAIDRKLEILLSSDSGVGTVKSMGLAVISVADALKELEPDLVLVLGDRYEIFAVAAAAATMGIPIAHLHGGELSEGAIDDALRHCISKLSHLHFVAADAYRKRVIQLGEAPERVFAVGALGVDGVARTKLLNKRELEDECGIVFGDRNLLVTFHPATLQPGEAEVQMGELLAALGSLEGVTLIFTAPNADTEGRKIMSMIDAFAASHDGCYVFRSLGHTRYLSCLAQVDGVVGNSSSGLIEAPAMRKGTINIGDRQRGRLRAESVIDVPPDRVAVLEAINRLWSTQFREVANSCVNPYGSGGASDRIVQILKDVSLEGLLMKTFHDVPVTD